MLTSLSTTTGQPSSLAEHLAHRELVPARHDRRRHRHAVAEADRAGHADADAVGRPGRGRRPAACRPGRARRPSTASGPCADVDVASWTCASTCSSRVGHRDVDRGRADVDADEADVAGEGDDARSAGRPGRRRARPTRPDRCSISRSSSTASLDRDRRTVSPSSARDTGPLSRRKRSSRACGAFSGRMDTRFTTTRPPAGRRRRGAGVVRRTLARYAQVEKMFRPVGSDYC